jgi:DNA repair ATPase RecN
MKITIENFQSINKAQVDVKGLTVITGQNNTGKSALARAITGVFTNPRGNSFVRIGSPSTSVNIDFEDGNNITWTKGKNVNQYEVNGKLIQKVGTEVPDEVYQASLVKPVEVDGKEVYPQVAKQFQQVFLIDLPPSSLASALSNVDIIQQLEKASSLARSDIKDLGTQLKNKNIDLTDQKDHLKKFDGIDRIEKILSHIDHLDTQIKHKENSLNSLEQEYQSREHLKALISELEEIIGVCITTDVNALNSLENSYNILNADLSRKMVLSSVVDKISDVIDVNIYTDSLKIEDMTKTLNNVLDLQVKQDRLTKAYEILKDTIDIENIDTDHILIENKNKVLEDIVDLQDRQVKAYKLYQVLKGIRNIDIKTDVGRLENLEDVVKLRRNRTRLKLALFILEGGLETLPKVKDIKENSKLDEVNNLKENRDKLRYALDVLNTEISKTEKELSELHIGDVCPLCNQGIGH